MGRRRNECRTDTNGSIGYIESSQGIDKTNVKRLLALRATISLHS